MIARLNPKSEDEETETAELLLAIQRLALCPASRNLDAGGRTKIFA
jgi:hypothetical protein